MKRGIIIQQYRSACRCRQKGTTVMKHRVFVLFLALLLVWGCGGGGGSNPSAPPAPGTNPPPTPTNAIVWKAVPTLGPNSVFAALDVMSNGDLIAAGSWNNGTSQFAAFQTIHDGGGTSFSMPASAVYSTPSAVTSVTVSGTNVVGVGNHGTPLKPALFILTQANLDPAIAGSPAIVPSCSTGAIQSLLLGARVFSGVAIDGTTGYVGVLGNTGASVITFNPADGTVDCSQTPFVVSTFSSAGISDIRIVGTTILVSGDTGTIAGSMDTGFVEAYNKTNHLHIWEATFAGTPSTGNLIKSSWSDGATVYASGSALSNQDKWILAKADFTTGAIPTGWPINPIAPSSNPSADFANAIVGNPGAGGGVILAGQTTRAGVSNPNSVQLTLAGIASDKTLLWSFTSGVSVPSTSWEQANALRATCSPSCAAYVAGTVRDTTTSTQSAVLWKISFK